MKFQFSVEIDRSSCKASKLFIDPKYRHENQEGFIKKVFKSGEEG
ncbi:MAG: hypothetical protein ACI9DJ_001086 [Algoriphagus sp.]